ncbi:Macrolide export ATP-binding/permease protein MacB [Nocardia seriolae]|uniref:Macrolide export ATP-binding/permease protein MacB n=1 Tax=Nocardia seriolae TaxID=37332 RepID=A0ABC8AKX6_9NOCA|nr:ABC transporter ATP-binding protein [Nocardia seriolae]APA94983.1 Macrolide export ATP-binding/permease protein MacB [Nocardia seriolae]
MSTCGSQRTMPWEDAAALLRIEGLQVEYRGGTGTTVAVRGASLEVRRGETVALVGESGSGKSTLAHAVIGLLDGGTVTGGEITFAGDRIDGAAPQALRRIRGARIGLVPQDPGTSLNPVLRIGAQVGEVLRIHGRADRRTAAIEAVRILEQAGLDRPELRARQYPQDLSGGQRQRVLIGIALACGPELVIADEPTSALDVTVQRRILDHLAQRTAESGTAVLLITHDLAVAAERADRIAVMREGRIVETGTAAEVLGNPRHEYTKRLIAAAPRSGRAERPRREHPALLLSATGLRKSFRITRDFTLSAVDEVSLEIDRGETLAVVGESGSGKSTTARIIARLTEPDAGTVTFDGRDITALRGAQLRALRRRIQVVYQNPYVSLNPKLTVGKIVAEPLQAFGIGDRSSRRATVAELLEQVALPGGYLDRRPAELSGGQRQRVAIARALALRPDLLVLDEPVSALDVSVQAQILDLLERLQAELDLAYRFISHDLAVVRRLADRVAVMRHGHLVETADTAALFGSPRSEYTRELLAAVPRATAPGAPVPLERTA